MRHDDCTMVLLNEIRALAAVLLLFVSSYTILSADDNTVSLFFLQHGFLAE